MKKLIVLAVLVAALTAVFATSALAAAPSTPTPPVPAGQGAGYGIHTPRAGLAAGQVPGQRRGAPEWAGDNSTPASIIGLTVEQLQAERLAGKSLAQIAQEKGMSKDVLVAKLVEARKAEVTKLLDAGKITQAQADYMLANQADRVESMVDRTQVGRPSFAGQSPMAGNGRGCWNR